MIMFERQVDDMGIRSQHLPRRIINAMIVIKKTHILLVIANLTPTSRSKTRNEVTRDKLE